MTPLGTSSITAAGSLGYQISKSVMLPGSAVISAVNPPTGLATQSVVLTGSGSDGGERPDGHRGQPTEPIAVMVETPVSAKYRRN